MPDLLERLAVRRSLAPTRVGASDLVAAALVVLSFALFSAQVQRFLGVLPVVWPDESLLAQPAMLLVREGRLAAPILTGAATGVTARAYWYPPGYMILLGGVFAAAGPTLVAMRMVSVVAGIVVLGLTGTLARAIGSSRLVAGAAVFLLAADPVFVRAALVGRPDMLALALVLGSLWLSRSGTPRRAVVAGICAGLAATVHPFGWIAVAVVLGEAVFRRDGRARWILAGASAPLLAWSAYIAQDLAAFLDQLSLNLALHERPWGPDLVLVGILDQYGRSPAIALAWIVGAAGLYLLIRRKPSGMAVGAAFALLSLTTVSLQMWHPLYALPLAYVGLAEVVQRAARWRPPQTARPQLRWALLLGVLSATLVGLIAGDVDQLTLRSSVASKADPEAYSKWTSQIAAVIPPGSRVLIAGVPDPAFALLDTDRQVFALQDDARSIAHFREHLATDIDYIVLAGSVSSRMLDLARSGASLQRVIVVDAGPHDTRCGDPLPCGSFMARIYEVAARSSARPVRGPTVSTARSGRPPEEGVGRSAGG